MSDPVDNVDNIEALLPFLANGTLSGDDRAAVEAAVAADPRLAAELAALRAVRAGMRSEPMAAGPGELGLARLLRDTAPPPPMGVPRRRLVAWQAAAVAFLALGLGQAYWQVAGPPTPSEVRSAAPTLVETGADPSASVPQAQAAPPPPAAEAVAREAAEASVADADALAATELGDAEISAAASVEFAPTATEAEISALLRAAGARLVDGPGPDGRYILAPAGPEGLDAAALSSAPIVRDLAPHQP